MEEESDESRRLQSSFGTSPSSSSSVSKQQQQHTNSSNSMNRFELPQLNTSSQAHRLPIRQFSQNFSPDSNNNKRAGIPPSHPQFPPPPSPYSQTPGGGTSRLTTNTTSPGPSHSRSLSQPAAAAFFSLDSLPPFSPSPPPYRDSQSNSVSDSISADVPMEDHNGGSSSNATPLSSSWGNPVRIGESLPPRKAHRRSNSDIPFGFASTILQSSPPNRGQNIFDQLAASTRNNLGMLKQNQLVKRESDFERDVERNPEGGRMDERKSEGEVIDDLFSAYLNLDNIDAMNSVVGMNDKNCHDSHEDLDSRASGTKTNGADSSDNETESSANESGSSMPMGNISSSAEKKEGNKRSAGAGGDIAPTTRHCRSVSMDSFMGNLPNFGDEVLKYPPSPGATGGQHSHSNSMDGNSTFSLDFGNGEFNGAELKKIMANEKLAEIALADPKRAKRILANRQSAARSKERKMRYISELEHKVQTLQTEATTLSAQLTLLQRDSSGLTTQNHELKFRLQAMEQQAHLRDALNEALTSEVQRLKVATAELGGDVHLSRCLDQQLSINPNMFHLHNKHSSQLNMYQQQQPQQQPQPQHQEQYHQQQQQQQQQQQRPINATGTKNKSNP